MGQKIPLSSEKTYSHEGIFDLKETYLFLKNFLENSRHYEVGEKELESKNDGTSKKLVSTIEAEQEYNDYYKVIIRLKLSLEGNEIIIENEKYVKGKAKLVINSYVETDFQNKRPKGPIIEFIEKVYNHYLDKDEFEKVAGVVEGDVSELINRFKQSINSVI